MKSLPLLAIASVLVLAACDKTADNAAAPKSTAAAVSAPAGTTWTETFAVTPEGGMLMGNPNAPVKLIEYGALTCSHCAEFSEKSKDALKAYVAKGTVSYEFRNYLLNVMDVPAALAARCGGPGPFFTIAEQLFADQRNWLGKAQAITPAEQQAWQSLAAEQLAPQLAAKLGLDSFVQQRGIGSEKIKACLADKTAIDQLGKMSETATKEFKISGTPTFIINGAVVPETSSWDLLEPKLTAAGA
jgi:protein-disulfide isomerase